jgi:CheY-like chemotaxis protein
LEHLKILIVEDEVLIAEDLKDILKTFGLKKIEMVHDKASALENLRLNKPDIAILDIRMEKELDGLIKYENVDKVKLDELSKNSDLVMDTTNNFMGLIDTDFFYELTLTLIYDKIKSTNFDSVTFVDGELFSIYPYKNNKFTLTDVKLTPLKKFSSINEIDEYKKIIDNEFILNKVKEFEDRVKVFIPEFNEFFKHNSYFLSIKSKINDESGNRYPVIKQTNNIISCFTGKIQGIYIIEDYILNVINNDK